MAITAKIFPNNRTSATVKDGETIVVSKHAVPGESLLKNLADVDSSVLDDGSLLIYDAPTAKFKTTTTIETDTGTIILNGGVF